MPRPAAIHLPYFSPHPVPTPGPLGDTLASRGLRLDYRSRCQPTGAAGRTYAVVVNGDRARVTCKGCLK